MIDEPEGTVEEQPAETESEAPQTEAPEQKPETQEEDNSSKSLSEHLKANFEKKGEKASSRDEKGRWTSKQPETPSQRVEQPAEVPLEAPKHWKAEHRELFNSMPEDARRFMLDRHKEMEGDYTKKTQDIAAERQKVERISQAFAPYAETLKQSGMDEATAVAQLIDSERRTQQFVQTFRQNPQAAIQWLGQTYGVDVSNLSIDDGDYSDPDIAELKQQNQELRNMVQQMQSEVNGIKTAPVHSQITEFQAAKDEQGNPRYPYFDKLRQFMAPLVAEGKSLEEAYNQVAVMIPEERERLLESERKSLLEKEAKRNVEARKKAEAARAAQGAPFRGGTVDSKGLDLSQKPLSEHLREKARQLGMAG